MKFIRPEDSHVAVHEVEDSDTAYIEQLKAEGFLVVSDEDIAAAKARWAEHLNQTANSAADEVPAEVPSAAEVTHETSEEHE
jgi:hypothetical protein